MKPALRIGLVAVSILLVSSCAAPPSQTPDAPASGALLAIYNARVPLDGVLSGGQPTAQQIEAAADAGVRTVINLRTSRETGFEWEAETVERLSMHYVHLPVGGGDGLTLANVEALDAALEDGLGRGPVLLHCGSGNRIGALLALREHWLRDVPADKAFAYGRANGMTSLQPKVREILELPAE
ncbi:MAG: hypothetical protein GY716_05480 [bacterium]|nr:hypothetical protein [bacterium]